MSSTLSSESSNQQDHQQQLELSDLEIKSSSSSLSNTTFKKIVYEQFRAAHHLALCSSTNEQFNTNCFTGVRVYDGSKILGSFLLTNESIQKYLSQASSSAGRVADQDASFSIIELGCGCGLSGISAMEVILSCGDNDENNNECNRNPKYAMTFTDMQPSCLELAKRNANRVQENHRKTQSSSPFSIQVETQILRWDEEGFREFQTSLTMMKKNTERSMRFNLILGAELIYFRVDMKALVATIKNLMLMNMSNNNKQIVDDDDEIVSEKILNDESRTTPPTRPNTICLLCHVNRVNGGREQLPRILDEFQLAHRNINMTPALAAMDLHPSIAASLRDRADFIAVALDEASLESVFTNAAVDFVIDDKKQSDQKLTKGETEEDNFMSNMDV